MCKRSGLIPRWNLKRPLRVVRDRIIRYCSFTMMPISINMSECICQMLCASSVSFLQFIFFFFDSWPFFSHVVRFNFCWFKLPVHVCMCACVRELSEWRLLLGVNISCIFLCSFVFVCVCVSVSALSVYWAQCSCCFCHCLYLLHFWRRACIHTGAYVRNDSRIVDIYYAAHTASSCILGCTWRANAYSNGFHVHYTSMQNQMKRKINLHESCRRVHVVLCVALIIITF